MDVTRAILGGSRNYGGEQAMDSTKSSLPYRQRTFKENIQDQIAAHKAKIVELEAVIDSMSPDVEKFVEALQKANL